MDERLIQQQEQELAKTGRYYLHVCFMTIPLLCMACFLYGLRPLLLCGAALLTGNLCDRLVSLLRRQYPMIEVKVHPIKNNFFGGNVGVAGLVTATDIIAQCEGRLSSGTLGVPAVMLREEKDTFLDDMTIEQLGQRLGVKVEVLPTGGGDEAKALLRSGLHIARRRRP